MLAVSSTSFVRALVVLAATTIAQAATDAAYSYDLSKATGPQFWAQLDIPDNQCGGDSNSPINVERKSECDRIEDYTLVVSSRVRTVRSSL